MQQRGRRLSGGRFLDAQPGLAQVGCVIDQLFVGGVFRVGAQNEAACGGAVGGGCQPNEALAQGFALRGWNFLRHTDVVVLRQEHQQAPRNADLRREAGTLGADGILENLHHQRLAFKDLPFDRQNGIGREHFRCAVDDRGRHDGRGCLGIERRRQWRAFTRRSVFGGNIGHEVGHMQESSAVQADVDEG